VYKRELCGECNSFALVVLRLLLLLLNVCSCEMRLLIAPKVNLECTFEGLFRISDCVADSVPWAYSIQQIGARLTQLHLSI
jgi:hypothetical protein